MYGRSYLNNTPHFALALLTLLLSISACHRAPSDAERLLDRIDSLCYVSPDSAMILLESINMEKLSEESLRARYALLLTKARDKCYISQTDDSLINIAVSYYDHHGTNLDRAQSYFYLASIYRDSNRQPEMLAALLRADYYAAKTKDHRLQALIFLGKGMVYHSNGFYEHADSAFSSMSRLAINLRDTLLISEAYSRRGDNYTSQGLYDKADYSLNIATRLSATLHNRMLSSVVARNSARLALSRNSYTKGLQLARKSWETCVSQENPLYLSVLGRAYWANHNYQIAESLLLRSISTDNRINAEVYELLSQISETKKDINLAKYYLSKRCETLENINKSQRSIQVVRAEYNTEIKRLKNEQSRTLVIIITIAVLSSCLFFTMFYYFNRQRSTRARKALQEKYDNTLTLLQAKISEIVTLRDALDTYRRETDDLLAIRKDADEMAIQRKSLVRETLESSLSYEKLMTIIADYKKYDSSKQVMTSNDWDAIIGILDQMYDNNLFNLRTKYSLEEEEMHICCLLLLNVKVTNMEGVIHVSRKTLYRRINRLATLFGLPTDAKTLKSFLKGEKIDISTV